MPFVEQLKIKLIEFGNLAGQNINRDLSKINEKKSEIIDFVMNEIDKSESNAYQGAISDLHRNPMGLFGE